MFTCLTKLNSLFQGISVKLCIVISFLVNRNLLVNKEHLFHLACEHVGIQVWRIVILPMGVKPFFFLVSLVFYLPHKENKIQQENDTMIILIKLQ